ncbi:MAG: RluA family pseudouridine synthase [Mollicutes bacterium]|nr:RluA family pseudouridine synthase [Mollicutes bacterium]MDY5875272.1 RluA family pseudouridine synthase [Bacilli bacterium]
MKITVKKEGELLDYLYNNIDMPKKRIKQYLTHGAIFVNNTKTTKYNYRILPGMTIMIDTDSKNKKTLPFDILFEDDHIIVVNKPSGLLTIATAKEKEKTLYHIVREYLVSKDKNARVFIVHRLDKDTSGVVVLAKDEKTKNKLQENWNEYVSLREYVAVVHGRLNKESDRIVQKLKETKTNLVYVSRDNDGKEAITNYKVIKENNDYSMVSITLETGRKNQIRVAFNTLHHPIVGDKKYSTIKDNESRLFLHANRLKMYYPEIRKDILFETSTPNEFKKIMN